MDINQLNISTAVFLRQLRMFSEHKTIQINDQTAELFMDIVQSIDELIASAQIIPVKTESNVDFLFNLNEKHFDLRQHIMCRMCIEQIGVSKDDLEMHVQKNFHMSKATEMMENAMARPPIEKTPNGSNDTDEDSNQIDYSVTKQSSSDAQSVCESKCDPMHIIRVINIPWTATKSSVVDLFPDLNIVKNGVHFIIDNDSNHNDAFIQLASIKDYHLAMNRQGIRMDYSTVETTMADFDDFVDLINQPSYPLNQRVIRLKELPLKCRAQDIRQFFKGLSVTEVHLIHSKAYQFGGEAFVMFETVDDVEVALGSVTKDNNKIQNKQIKVFRSSQEQFKMYCDTSTIKKLSTCVKDEPTSQLEDLVYSKTIALNNQNSAGSINTPGIKNNANDFGIILVCGLPWGTSKADVASFFADCEILKDGIEIKRRGVNGPNEARMFVRTKYIRKALARNNLSFGSRTIHGT